MNASSPFEFIKLNISSYVGVGLFALLMWQFARLRRSEIKWNKALTIMVVILFSLLLSTVFSLDPYLSFWGDDQMPADSVLTHLIFFCFSFAVLQIIDLKKDLNLILNIIVVSGALLALHGIAQHFGLDFEIFSKLKSLQGRSIGTIGQPVVFATVIGVASLTAMMQFVAHNQSKNKWFYLAAMAVLQLALLYSAARMAFVLDKIFLVIICFNYFKTQSHQYKKIAIGLAVGLVTTLVSTALSENGGILQKFSFVELKKAIESRQLVLGDGLKGWKDAPIIGSGPETYYIVQKQKASLELNKYEYWKLRWTKAHNMPVHILVCNGILGFVLFLLLPLMMGYQTFNLLFSKSFEFYSAQKINLGLICSFIFLANLTAFNFIYTEMLSAILPVLFFSLGGKENVFLINSKLKQGACGGLLIMSLFLMFSVHNYWLSDTYFQKSQSTLVEENNIEALRLVDGAIELHGKNPFLHCHRANVLYKTLAFNKERLTREQIKSVVEVLSETSNTCIELAPNRFEPYFARATLFSAMFMQGFATDDETARKSLIKFKELAPTHPGPLYLLGLLDEKKAAYPEFIKNMQDSVALKPDFFTAYVPLLKFYYSQNDRAKVNELFGKITTTETHSREVVSDIQRMSRFAKENSDDENFAKINAYYEKVLEQIRTNSDSLN